MANYEDKCPRCGRSNCSKCSKTNGYCVRCDDETSYDYCTPKPIDTSELGPIKIDPMATIRVIDADRRLFIALFKLPERHHDAIMRGEKDGAPEMQAIAGHRWRDH